MFVSGLWVLKCLDDLQHVRISPLLRPPYFCSNTSKYFSTDAERICVFSSFLFSAYISFRAVIFLLKYIKILFKAQAVPDMFVLWPLSTQNPSRQVWYHFGFASRHLSAPGPICSNSSIHFPTSELSITTVLLIHVCCLASQCPNGERRAPQLPVFSNI